MADSGLQEPSASSSEGSPPEVSSTDTLRLTANDAVDAARQTAEEVRRSIGAGMDETRERVAEKTEEIKNSFADQIGSTAAALDIAANELDAQAVSQNLLREAAKSLTSISEALQGKSLGNIVADLSDLGRRNPAAFIGGAALAGFVLARFAQASAPGEMETAAKSPAYARNPGSDI